jgi:hypothetical protein
MLSLIHQGGWVKHEVEATCGVDEDTDGDTVVVRGTGWDIGAARGTGVDAGAVRGVGVDAEAASDVDWGTRVSDESGCWGRTWHIL